MFSLNLLLLCISLARSATVNTQSGTVTGSTVYYMGKPVHQFLGIPFAKPPVGNLRFREPEPVQPWSHTLQAVNFPPSCVQYYPFNYPFVDSMPGQSEDCLYLNIWVPENDNKEPKAVMFWVFSGGFTLGSNRLPVYNGHVLAAEGDVIVILINYRIGILGFLSVGTEDAPGNMGLLDVVEALKWTNNNIGAFGGDTNRITVFGHSAGGWTAGYLTISPLSKGLFQRAIMQSGSAILLEDNPMKKNLELGQKVACAVGCASNTTTLKDNPREVVGCLQKINADVLIRTANSFKPSSTRSFFAIHGDSFLPVEPLQAVKNGDFEDVDVLAGCVKDELSLILTSEFYQIFGPYGERNTKINKTVGKDLILKLFEDFDFKQDVANYYLSDVSECDYDKVRSQTYHSYGDFLLICPLIYLAESFSSKQSKTYFYYYYHQSKNTVFEPWMGVTHFSEVPFVFGRPLDQMFMYSYEEMQLSKNMIQLWTNFAKDGVPSSTWREFSKSDPFIQNFYLYESGDNYLMQHLQNCDFYRRYYGFV